MSQQYDDDVRIYIWCADNVDIEAQTTVSMCIVNIMKLFKHSSLNKYKLETKVISYCFDMITTTAKACISSERQSLSGISEAVIV